MTDPWDEISESLDRTIKHLEKSQRIMRWLIAFAVVTLAMCLYLLAGMVL